MPALPPVPDTLRLTLKYSSYGDADIINRWYHSYEGGPPDSADLGLLLLQVFAAWGAQLKALYATTMELIELEAVDLSSATAGAATLTEATTGTRAGTQLPLNCAALLNFKVSRRYRGGKPRMYIPFGVDADLLDPQHWTVANAAGFATQWGAFIGEIDGFLAGTTTVGPQVNVSYYEGFTSVLNPITGRTKDVAKPRADPLVDLIVATECNPRIGTQRRRIGIRT